jgi:hypothetical protein
LIALSSSFFPLSPQGSLPLAAKNDRETTFSVGSMQAGDLDESTSCSFSSPREEKNTHRKKKKGSRKPRGLKI